MRDVMILDACRTPRGRGKPGVGALSSVHPQELVAQILNALPARTGLLPEDVEDVVVGCVSQADEQGACIARNAVLAAAWPTRVTGVALNRYCGSGLQAVAFGAMGIASGYQELVVGCGVESMSRVPFGTDGGDIDGKNAALRRRYRQVPQGIAADLVAMRYGISRAELDRFATLSQRRAANAIKENRFARSLVSVRDQAGKVLLESDEHPRPTTLRALSALPPAFAALGARRVDDRTLDEIALLAYPDIAQIEHVHTAGNSSGIVDGAAAVVLSSAAYAARAGLRPRGRIVSFATAGTEPVIMLTGAAPAARAALRKAGMTPCDIDLWEINEAFAAVPIQTVRALEIQMERVNVSGGAIALGHPLGATGTMLVGTALDELELRGLSTALISICIGGGMGVAMVIERC